MVRATSVPNGAPRGVPPTARIALGAAGLRVGGGLVLLEALLAESAGRLSRAILDVRVRERLEAAVGDVPARWVGANPLARLSALRALAREAGPDEVLLCFNSLPPPVRSRARTVVFVHGPHIGGVNRGVSYSPATALRLGLERAWFGAFHRNADDFWVQTGTMARSLAHTWRLRGPVEVVPVVDPLLLGPRPAARAAARPAGFVYPADGVGHKNHLRLLRAWRVLAERGAPPPLVLTLPPDALRALGATLGVDPAAIGITTTGPVGRDRVLELLHMHGALVFPSLAETFGLPLIEAERLGVTIVASERDFVRDVCRPDQTFDPESEVSIARAVMRAMGDDPPVPPFVGAADFLDRLVQRAAPRRDPR